MFQDPSNPATRASRTMFGGAWLRLLGDVHGQPKSLEEFLGLVTQNIRARGALWVPDAGSAVYTGTFQPREVDWESLRSLQPGQWAALHQAAALRRPFGASGRGEDWYIRTRPGITPAGVLRVWFAADGLGGEQEALDLADSVSGASVLIAERSKARQDQCALQLGARAAGFVHDLRNRLTLVLLQQERFSIEGNGGHANTEGLELLEQARALCASFVPTGDLGLVPQSTLLRPLLLQEAQSAATMARRGDGVAVRVRCPAELRTWADPIGITRVLDNVLINGIDASRAGGEVRVQARRGAHGVEIIVEDFGLGMSEEGLRRAYSAGQSGTSHNGGTGYGSVSMLSTLAEMGGELRVESGVGQGTCVTITLPNPLDSQGPRVLIVESDPRRAQNMLRRARGEGSLALALPNCSAAIRMVGEMSIQEVWLPRGMRDASMRDLIALLERRQIPAHMLSSRGLMPLARNPHHSV